MDNCGAGGGLAGDETADVVSIREGFALVGTNNGAKQQISIQALIGIRSGSIQSGKGMGGSKGGPAEDVIKAMGGGL